MMRGLWVGVLAGGLFAAAGGFCVTDLSKVSRAMAASIALLMIDE